MYIQFVFFLPLLHAFITSTFGKVNICNHPFRFFCARKGAAHLYLFMKIARRFTQVLRRRGDGEWGETSFMMRIVPYAGRGTAFLRCALCECANKCYTTAPLRNYGRSIMRRGILLLRDGRQTGWVLKVCYNTIRNTRYICYTTCIAFTQNHICILSLSR